MRQGQPAPVTQHPQHRLAVHSGAWTASSSHTAPPTPPGSAQWCLDSQLQSHSTPNTAWLCTVVPGQPAPVTQHPQHRLAVHSGAWTASSSHTAPPTPPGSAQWCLDSQLQSHSTPNTAWQCTVVPGQSAPVTQHPQHRLAVHSGAWTKTHVGQGQPAPVTQRHRGPLLPTPQPSHHNHGLPWNQPTIISRHSSPQRGCLHYSDYCTVV